MKTEMIMQDYYGASYFLEAHSDKNLTVFIIDDNKLYLNLIKNVIKRPNITVHAFEIGEDALKVLDLEPDLVIVDYHLDGVNPGVMKGDKIADLIKAELPDCEVIMISSDQKFKLFVDLKMSTSKNIMYKDKTALDTLKTRTNKMWKSKLLNVKYKKSLPKMLVLSVLGIAVIVALILFFIKN